MRQLTEIELERLKQLSSKDIEVALIEPTENGLNKSILDATQALRYLLETKGLHNYRLQLQGPENKKIVIAHLLDIDNELESKTSLYRPETKDGDPRIWFSNLRSYCNAGDMLGIAVHDNELWVINLTRIDISKAIESDNLIGKFAHAYSLGNNLIAEELLSLIRAISVKGFLPGTIDADTAIGRLLEDELGIPMNANRTPDYKGIEIKSFRSERNNRKNLFAQVPQWEISKFKSSKEILDAFGYERDGVRKLYCTVNSLRSNSQGLMLVLDQEQLFEKSINQEIGNFIAWKLEKLRERLLEKHSETFWVSADCKIIDGQEYFHFTKIEHTKGPLVNNLEPLIELGKITVDHLIKEKGTSAVEKGPIFKLHQDSLGILFPASKMYNLLDSI
jgi:hypothetical protein